jgi:hypothetical protein
MRAVSDYIAAIASAGWEAYEVCTDVAKQLLQ